MRKIISAVLILLVISVLLVSCNGTSGKNGENSLVHLESEEIDVIDQMGNDVRPVNGDSYIETVSELKAHTSQYKGKVYQLEGKFTLIDDVPYLTRTLVHGSEKVEYGMPLKYLEKEIASGAWIRVTAIINFGEVNGETVTVLEIVAIESLPTPSNTDIKWDGSDLNEHHHH